MNPNSYKTQSTFSKYVRICYNNKCVVCGHNTVEACRIVDQYLFKNNAFLKFSPINGILLCPNHHTAYYSKNSTTHFVFDVTKNIITNNMICCPIININIDKRKSIGQAFIYPTSQQLLLWRYYVFTNQHILAMDLLKRLQCITGITENTSDKIKHPNIVFIDKDKDIVMTDAIPL